MALWLKPAPIFNEPVFFSDLPLDGDYIALFFCMIFCEKNGEASERDCCYHFAVCSPKKWTSSRAVKGVQH